MSKQCITREEKKIATPQALKVCDDKPVRRVRSRYCILDGCPGHLMCQPCLDVNLESGFAKQVLPL